MDSCENPAVDRIRQSVEKLDQIHTSALDAASAWSTARVESDDARGAPLESVREAFAEIQASASEIVRIADSPLKVGFVGQYKSGKSSLINALLVFADEKEGNDPSKYRENPPRVTDFDPIDTHFTEIGYGTDKGDDEVREHEQHIKDRRLPIRWLEDLLLVDTPGSGEQDRYDRLVHRYLRQCDVLLYLFPVHHMLDSSDRATIEGKIKDIPSVKMQVLITHEDRVAQRYPSDADKVKHRLVANLKDRLEKAVGLRLDAEPMWVDSYNDQGGSHLYNWIAQLKHEKLGLRGALLRDNAKRLEKMYSDYLKKWEALRNTVAQAVDSVFEPLASLLEKTRKDAQTWSARLGDRVSKQVQAKVTAAYLLREIDRTDDDDFLWRRNPNPESHGIAGHMLAARRMQTRPPEDGGLAESKHDSFGFFLKSVVRSSVHERRFQEIERLIRPHLDPSAKPSFRAAEDLVDRVARFARTNHNAHSFIGPLSQDIERRAKETYRISLEEKIEHVSKVAEILAQHARDKSGFRERFVKSIADDLEEATRDHENQYEEIQSVILTQKCEAAREKWKGSVGSDIDLVPKHMQAETPDVGEDSVVPEREKHDLSVHLDKFVDGLATAVRAHQNAIENAWATFPLPAVVEQVVAKNLFVATQHVLDATRTDLREYWERRKAHARQLVGALIALMLLIPAYYVVAVRRDILAQFGWEFMTDFRAPLAGALLAVLSGYALYWWSVKGKLSLERDDWARVTDVGERGAPHLPPPLPGHRWFGRARTRAHPTANRALDVITGEVNFAAKRIEEDCFQMGSQFEIHVKEIEDESRKSITETAQASSVSVGDFLRLHKSESRAADRVTVFVDTVSEQLKKWHDVEVTRIEHIEQYCEEMRTGLDKLSSACDAFNGPPPTPG
ncbi:MAG: 50S ribosome-binding GTPase [Planctomycetes bacterium]|nr:50S ribosome-binding GTPase [Planctomycetota bacterium]